MKFLDLPHKDEDYIELRPANDEYPVFKVDNPAEFSVWGRLSEKSNIPR